MDEFPSNAQTGPKQVKDEPKPEIIQKVITGEVIRRKTPLGKRFKETFIGGDAKGVWGYIVMDVLVPSAKDTIADAFSQGIERMLFGDSGGGRSRRGRGRVERNNGYVSYNRISTNQNRGFREETRELSRRGRAVHDFDEIILATRDEANDVISQLFELISKYEVATVADLYSMVGIPSNFVDKKWGWTDIRGAGATRIRNGYLLDLPKPESLD